MGTVHPFGGALHRGADDAIYLIFDASGSMWGELPDKSRKVTVAKQVLEDFVADDFENYELAQPLVLKERRGAVHNGVAKKRSPCEPARQKKHIYSSEVVTCEVEGVPL